MPIILVIITWQVTDNTSMFFSWVNDNGTSFDNISFYPEQLIYSSGKFTALGRSSYTSEHQAKAVIQSNDGLNWDLVTPVLKTIGDNGSGPMTIYIPADLFAYGNGKYVTLGRGYRNGQNKFDPERGYNTYIQSYSSSAYVTDNISMDNVSWQITDNTSMVFNWVNDNGTSFDNISFYPEKLLFSSGKFTALGRSSYTGENQAKAVIQSSDGLNWNLLTPVLKSQPSIYLDNGSVQHFYVPTDLLAYGNGKYVILERGYGNGQNKFDPVRGHTTYISYSKTHQTLPTKE